MLPACLVARNLSLLAAFVTCVSWAWGCGGGDGDGGDGGADAGLDAATDAGRDAFIRPALDATTSSGDPVPSCMPGDPLGCGASQECDLVLRSNQGASPEFYPGCIPQTDDKDDGVICDPLAWTPVEAPGLTDNVVQEPCEEEFVCAPVGSRGLARCQPLCAQGLPCTRDGEYCSGVGLSGVQLGDTTINGIMYSACVPHDDCDVLTQTGCSGDEACYAITNTIGQVLTICASFVEPQDGTTGAVGEPCSFLNGCQPGSSCWGPPRMDPMDWTVDQLRCRAHCEPGSLTDAGVMDAGASDGGAGALACGMDQSCVDLDGTGIDVGEVSTPPAFCE